MAILVVSAKDKKKFDNLIKKIKDNDEKITKIRVTSLNEETMKKLADAVSKNTMLVSLTVSFEALDYLEKRVIARSYQNKLDITDFGDSETKELIESPRLLALDNLVEKSICNPRKPILRRSIKKIEETKPNLTKSKSVLFEKNVSPLFKEIAKIIRENFSLTSIYAKGIKMDTLDMDEIYDSLLSNDIITSLDLSYYYNYSDKFNQIDKLIKRNNEYLKKSIEDLKHNKRMKYFQIKTIKYHLISNDENNYDSKEFYESLTYQNKLTLYNYALKYHLSDDLIKLFQIEGLIKHIAEYLTNNDIESLISTISTDNSFSSELSTENKSFHSKLSKYSLYLNNFVTDNTQLAQSFNMEYQGDIYRVDDVLRDGNCFFHVVERQTGIDQNIIRRNIVNQILNNHLHYNLNVIEQKSGESFIEAFNRYIDDMSTSGTWADHLAMQALADLGYRINVFENDTRFSLNPRTGEELLHEINLLYVNNNHFMSVSFVGPAYDHSNENMREEEIISPRVVRTFDISFICDCFRFIIKMISCPLYVYRNFNNDSHDSSRVFIDFDNSMDQINNSNNSLSMVVKDNIHESAYQLSNSSIMLTTISENDEQRTCMTMPTDSPISAVSTFSVDFEKIYL